MKMHPRLNEMNKVEGAIHDLERLSHILTTVLEELWAQKDSSEPSAPGYVRLGLLVEQIESADYLPRHMHEIASRLKNDWEDLSGDLIRDFSPENAETGATS